MKNSLESSLLSEEEVASSSMKETDSAPVDLDRRGIVGVAIIGL